MTRYNSYDYARDPRKMFPPEALAEIAAYDAQLDALEREMIEAKCNLYSRQAAYYHRHKAQRAAYAKRYSLTHHDQIRAAHRRYEERNAEKIREYHRAEWQRRKARMHAEKAARASAAATSHKEEAP